MKIYSIKILIQILIGLITFTNCTDKVVTPKGIEIILIESIPIDIKEPSGLTFNNDKTKLWIVGDNEPKIYLTDLRGNIEKKYSVSKNDLEGITSIGDSILAVVVERTREILLLTLKGNSERTIKTNLQGQSNNGLEGISYVPREDKIFIANEKNPKLFLLLDLDGNILSNKSIDFSKDIAGLFYDNMEDVIWILGQENNTIYKCNTNLDIIERYSMPNKKYEGIAVLENTIYLVSDTEQLLSVYQIPE
jgi:uncharacterized protein YjiK